MRIQTVFLEVDLSQAEDRVVKVLSGHPEAIELAHKHPAEFDAHTHSAARLFSVVRGHPVALGEITKHDRNTGKRVRHAKNYGMQPPKLQEVFLKEDGVFVPLKECEALLAAIDVVEPWVDKYQQETRLQIMKSRLLRNSWNREISFAYDRLDDTLYRRAYAWTPQSEVGDLLNQWGFVALDLYLIENQMQSRINLQVHDALIVSAVPEELGFIAAFLDKSLSRERVYPRYGIKLGIPVEFAINRHWGKAGRIEWKRLPPKEELEAKIHELLAVS